MSRKVAQVLPPQSDFDTLSVNNSVVESEFESEERAANAETQYKIELNHSTPISKLEEFLSDHSMLNQSNDPTTNIVDRFKKRSYNIPEKRIQKFMFLLENCRTQSRHLYPMFNELQNAKSSGIMLDFDVYQDDEHDQFTDDIFQALVQELCKLLKTYLKFTEKKTTLYMGVIRRHDITEQKDKNAYKDGFHIIIPSIKVSRNVKKLLIQKILDCDLLDRHLSDIKPASKMPGYISSRESEGGHKQYSQNNFLDTMSSSVPVFFVGCKSKPVSKPYKLTNVYRCVIDKDKHDATPTISSAIETFKPSTVNKVYEFSLNWEVPNGIIKKIHYEIQEKWTDDLLEYSRTVRKDDIELSNNIASVSLYDVFDVRGKEIRELLDAMSPRRADEFKSWFNIISILAGISTTYKPLAEYFSRKSSKFNLTDFEAVWTKLLSNRTRLPSSLGYIKQLAQADNPERFKSILQSSIKSVVKNMIHESYREGNLSHSDMALIVYTVLQHKYVTSIPGGEKKMVWYEFMMEEDRYVDGALYKWYRHDQEPHSLMIYISDILPKILDGVLKDTKNQMEKQASDGINKYLGTVLKNFKRSMQNLGNRSFKRQVVSEAETRFYDPMFAVKLDKNEMILGVQNGVLLLPRDASQRPQLIQGYHSHLVSRFTTTPLIIFDPLHPKTKEILLALRNIWPDNEADSHNFIMSFLASSIDGRVKESLFIILLGGGANGKSVIMELHKAAVGDTYVAKMQMAFLTTKTSTSENATPAIMMLKYARFAYFSESDSTDRLNTSKVKEITGQETIAGRGLNKDMENFKPTCQYIATTNHEFEIDTSDYGTWRRLKLVMLRNTFKMPDQYDASEPTHRIANPFMENWSRDQEYTGRYLGILVWYYYWLQVKYGGKVVNVPHPHIDCETKLYAQRQNVVMRFLNKCCVTTKDPKTEVSFDKEVLKYTFWYTKNQQSVRPPQAKDASNQLANSVLSKYIRTTARGLMLVGVKFLEFGEDGPGEGEKYVFDGEKQYVQIEEAKGVNNETSAQYYERICREFEEHKHIFNNEITTDLDLDFIRANQRDIQQEAKYGKIGEVHKYTSEPAIETKVSNDPNVTYIGGIAIHAKPLQEPNLSKNRDDNILDDGFDMCGYLPDTDE